MGIGDKGVEALARVAGLGRLSYLMLGGNNITAGGAQVIADAPLANWLSVLFLGKNSITPAGKELFMRRFGDRVHF